VSDPLEPLVDAHAVAEHLGVPVSWVYESARNGGIPHYRLGKYVRFKISEVDAWLAECRRVGRTVRLRVRS
jgi:excisionase family DNA binding protein